MFHNLTPAYKPTVEINFFVRYIIVSSQLLLAVSDYYQLDDLLTDEEKALRKKVRAISEKEIAQIGRAHV